MSSRNKTQSGYFTVFGFTRDPGFIEERLSARLGITPQTIKIGSVGQFFYYTTYGEIAESEEIIVVKLGFLRSMTKSPLNARQLLEQKLVKPQLISTNGFSGNGLVVGISKTEPVFSAFQTLMAIPQLYYSNSDDIIICSDMLRCLVGLIPQPKLNESILPQHFLYRSVYGSSTYYSGINRLIPGYCMVWKDGHIQTHLERKLDAIKSESQYIRNDDQALNLIFESLGDVIGDCARQVEATGHQAATLLSGGVDSSLVQYGLNSRLSPKKWRSTSFAIEVPSFDFEVEYARQASQLLETVHTFVNYSPEDYAGLLSRVIAILAQPPNLETEPSFLAVADYIQKENWPERFFFTGQGGDTLFGGEAAIKLKGLHYVRKMPFAAPLLKGLGVTLAPIAKHYSHMLLRGAEIISSDQDPDAYFAPMNDVCVYVLDENRDIIQRCFGDRALREALAFRRNLVAQYSNSHHYLDQVYFIDLSTDLWELGVQRQQLFLAHHLEMISPYFDEDVIKAALTIHPDIRYIKGFRYKHLLRRLLKEKTNAPVATKRKGTSTVNEDLVAWMKSGSLRPLVEDMSRPDFMSKADFECVKQRSDYFLWPLLTLDIFCKHMLKH